MYPAMIGDSTIGTLLRKIVEERATQKAVRSPWAEVGSPFREMVQEPLKSPESPGTSRVVSLRPEISTEGLPSSTLSKVPPTQYVPRVVVSPVQPRRETPLSSQIPASIPVASGLDLGARISPTPTFIPKPTYKRQYTPALPRVGTYITKINWNKDIA